MSGIDRVREHQANERTFLAWLRTAIALIAFGFAIARFGLFLRELKSAVIGEIILTRSPLSSHGIGVSLVLLGIAMIIMSVWRYNAVFLQIEQNDYRPNRFIVWLTAGVVIAFCILSLLLLLWRQIPVPSVTVPMR